MNCPLCGALVVYEGLNAIECEGAPKPAVPAFHGIMGGAPPRDAVPAQPACPNYRAPAVPVWPAEFSFHFALGFWMTMNSAGNCPVLEAWTPSGWVIKSPGDYRAQEYSKWRRACPQTDH